MIWFEFQFENEHWTVYKEFIVSKKFTLYKHRHVSKRSIKLFHHIKLAFI